MSTVDDQNRNAWGPCARPVDVHMDAMAVADGSTVTPGRSVPSMQPAGESAS